VGKPTNIRITNRAGLPEPLVAAVSNDPYDPGEAEFTVTELLSPPRQTQLIREHAGELSEDAADRIYALMGQVAHEILARAGENGIREERLSGRVEVFGKHRTISGAFDHMALIEAGPEMVLQDYKIASVWEAIFGVKPDRVAQLNALAWLAEQNGKRVDRLEVVFIFRDWQKSKAKRDSKYPSQPALVYPVPFWNAARVEQELRRQMISHLAAREILPECTPDERWEAPESWAVYRNANKRASRVLDTEENAIRWAGANFKPNDRARIELRPGESRRCLDYCIALAVCEQGQALVNVEEAPSDD